ncbi:MAG: BrnA antitoxin family protein [Candidatus Shapirobacteria bacterium]|nr:BrnA antitoxin family protein [Candidatus Shapirobacteria bacterium]
MKKFKPIPKFKSEDEEFEFWQKADSTEYFDWSKAKRGVMFPNLKLTSKLVTIRMPIGLVDRLKVKANKMDIPYQSLVKEILFKSLM